MFNTSALSRALWSRAQRIKTKFLLTTFYDFWSFLSLSLHFFFKSLLVAYNLMIKILTCKVKKDLKNCVESPYCMVSRCGWNNKNLLLDIYTWESEQRTVLQPSYTKTLFLGLYVKVKTLGVYANSNPRSKKCILLVFVVIRGTCTY